MAHKRKKPSSDERDAAPEPIDLDDADSLDPADAIDREQLIAEMMAFVAADDEPTEDEPTEDGGPGSPIIGANALAALSEMRSEGVTLPDELVLDLGETMTPEERELLMRSAGAQAEMQDAAYRVSAYLDRTKRLRKGLIGVVLCAVAIGVAIRPPGWVVPPAGAQLTEADHLYGVRVTLLLQAQQIEAFRAREERLPTTLAEITVAFPRVRFARLDNRLYQLVAYTPDGDAVLYDSTAPGPEFQRIRASWITTAEGL